MNRMIIVGSPRVNGRSAHLAELLFESCIEQYPEDEVSLVPVSELEIGPCIGCGACRKLAAKGWRIPEPEESSAENGDASSFNQEHDDGSSCYPSCVFADDMQDVYELLPSVDELIIVSPVYFSGAPSPMKALLDRLQPYFWTDARHAELRPATLHVIGEGHDPCGFEALVSEVKSSTLVAGFKLDRVLSWVGRIDENGDIEADPEVILGGGLDAEGAAREFEPEDTRAQAHEKKSLKLQLSSEQPSKPAKREPDAVGKAAQKVASKAVAKAAGKAAGKAVGKAKGKAAGKAVGKVAGKAAGKAAGKVAGKAVGKAAGKAVEKRTAKSSAKATGKQSAKGRARG